MTSQTLRWANLAVAFLLELCALAALGYWGVQTGDGPVTKTALGVGAPLLAVLWGLFAAPRALLGSKRLTDATLDRLTHRCQIIETKGESYRLIDEGQSHETPLAQTERPSPRRLGSAQPSNGRRRSNPLASRPKVLTFRPATVRLFDRPKQDCTRWLRIKK